MVLQTNPFETLSWRFFSPHRREAIKDVSLLLRPAVCVCPRPPLAIIPVLVAITCADQVHLHKKKSQNNRHRVRTGSGRLGGSAWSAPSSVQAFLKLSDEILAFQCAHVGERGGDHIHLLRKKEQETCASWFSHGFRMSARFGVSLESKKKLVGVMGGGESGTPSTGGAGPTQKRAKAKGINFTSTFVCFVSHHEVRGIEVVGAFVPERGQVG